MTTYKRFEGETDEQLILRICGLKSNIGTWSDVCRVLNELLGEDKKPNTYRNKFQSYNKMFEGNLDRSQSDIIDEIVEQRRELEKERRKLQAEKTDYNRWLRENARDELIVEKIENAISELQPYENPMHLSPLSVNDKKGILSIADAHYGIEFEIKGLFGETINKYSPEIFEERMWKLFDKTIEIIEQNHLTELHIFDLGDGIDGILRLSSQLMKLRYGIIDSTIRYADFLANWLNELSKYVNIKFQMVKDSNHTQLRICNAPKGSFTEENMNKVMLTLIKERLKTNPNVRIIENPTGLIYSNICGYNILAIHGEVKNLGNAVNEFSRTYDTKINYILAGHKHHAKYEEIGMDCEAINVRSIIGVDNYGLSLNKTSNAGASLFIFEAGLGKTCEYTIKLN